jgi:hypothetical protein
MGLGRVKGDIRHARFSTFNGKTDRFIMQVIKRDVGF